MPRQDSRAAQPSPEDKVGAELAQLNAQAKLGSVTESVGGLQIVDPFRALETESPLTSEWIDAQTDVTARALAPHREPKSEARLRELLAIGMIGEVRRGGQRVFFTMREGAREQAALYMLGQNGPSMLVDPLSTGPRAALDYIVPSPGGRYVALGISKNGDERAQLSVIDADTGEPLPDVIDHAKWTSLSWLHDESGFYYTRYPKPGEPHYDANHEDSYFPGVFFHRLGTDPGADPMVFQSDTGTDFPTPEVGDADRYLLLTNFRGWTASDLWLLDRGEAPAQRVDAPDSSHPLQALTKGRDKLTSGVVHDGQLYLLTNEGAPRNRIVRVAPDAAADRNNWRDLVPQSDATIDSWTILKGHLAVHMIRNVRSELKLFSIDGRHVGDIALPSDGSVESLSSTHDSDRLHFAFSSFFIPPTIYQFQLGAEQPTRVHQVAHNLDTANLTLRRGQAKSQDGTPINVFYVHRRDLKPNGTAPVLLRGYGGFDVSLLPSFTRTALHWIEQGGVFAVANLRGGGEFGETWHRAGMLKNKHHVFEDFEAAIAFFSDSGLSRPDRIAIAGGSNGGLLMGAMITRSPKRFAAAIASVGLYDMVRYVNFPPAELWVSEYGDPTDPDMVNYLQSYSPYHQVKDGTRYPAVLIETADHDTRVHWAHSTKFAARLQQATSSGRPIYFHMERKMGHGRGTRLTDLVEKVARQHAFLRAALGSPPAPAGQ